MRRLIQLVSCIVVCALLASFATAAGPAGHSTSKRGVKHADDMNLPYTSHCTDCHAADLSGGVGPACADCHEVLWDEADAANLAAPLDHTDAAGHKPGHGSPYITPEGEDYACSDCHGSNLANGFAATCYDCHDRLWAGDGPPEDHTLARGALILHKPGLGEPLTEGCALCHGENLNDGFAPSCFDCHEANWAGTGPPEDHTALLMNLAAHKPGYHDPLAEGCTQCHGENLNDGYAFSCYGCHDDVWTNLPPIVDSGTPYTIAEGSELTIDASRTVDPNCDTMTFDWDFGDGTPYETTGSGPTVKHTYTTAGTYTGTVAVNDGVNGPVGEQFTVEVVPASVHDNWLVSNTASPPETLAVTFEDHNGSLVAVIDDGVSSRLAYGVEFNRVIFWMELWMEVGVNVSWGVGDIYFGVIDRELGTMEGVLFDDEGAVFTFTGEAL